MGRYAPLLLSSILVAGIGGGCIALIVASSGGNYTPTPPSMAISIPDVVAQTPVPSPEVSTATQTESGPSDQAGPPLTVVTSLSDLRMIMLDLINSERAKKSVAPVELGSSGAAQVYAETMRDGCYTGHYSLAPIHRRDECGGVLNG